MCLFKRKKKQPTLEHIATIGEYLENLLKQNPNLAGFTIEEFQEGCFNVYGHPDWEKYLGENSTIGVFLENGDFSVIICFDSLKADNELIEEVAEMAIDPNLFGPFKAKASEEQFELVDYPEKVHEDNIEGATDWACKAIINFLEAYKKKADKKHNYQ